MDYRISVIVPVYNVENYLIECLDSLVSQTMQDIEVIMINDGSTDSSGSIIDRYAEMYHNFKAIHKKNQGLGNTRNYGVMVAKGEYVAFLDSDDYVPINTYEIMYQLAQYYNNADVVLAKAIRFNTRESHDYDPVEGVYEGIDYITNIKNTPQLLHNGIVANKLHRRQFLLENELLFPENILYEDTYFSLKEYLLASKIVVSPRVCYYWRIREDRDNLSISQTNNNLNNLIDRLNINKMCDELIAEINPGRIIENQWNLFKCRNLLASYSLMVNNVSMLDKPAYIHLLKTELMRYDNDILALLNDDYKLRFHSLIYDYTDRFFEVKDFIFRKKNQTNLPIELVNIDNNYIQLIPCDSKPIEVVNHLFDITSSISIIKGIDNIEVDSDTIQLYGYAFKQYFNYPQGEFLYQAFFKVDNKEYKVETESMKREDLTYVFDGEYDYTGYKIVINVNEVQKIMNENRLNQLKMGLYIRFTNQKKEFETRIGSPKFSLGKLTHKFKKNEVILSTSVNKNNNLNFNFTRYKIIDLNGFSSRVRTNIKKIIHRMGRYIK
ncbi:glycosyltransferase family 2 protein [Paenibacillus sp. CR_12]|uniref:glycosyltransferase family 2 protein n=1 Tax=Paenibacillus sp. CR_12 TaxID=3055793 RepID=UPI0035BF4A1E